MEDMYSSDGGPMSDPEASNGSYLYNEVLIIDRFCYIEKLYFIHLPLSLYAYAWLFSLTPTKD